MNEVVDFRPDPDQIQGHLDSGVFGTGLFNQPKVTWISDELRTISAISQAVWRIIEIKRITGESLVSLKLNSEL